jgi:hypothetical protein
MATADVGLGPRARVEWPAARVDESVASDENIPFDEDRMRACCG